MPNSVGVDRLNATLTISAAILVEAALPFLGFGIQYPDVSLGSLISTYQASILTGEPYLFFWPGIFIILIVLCLNFIGDGLRDAYDPRQKRIPKAKDLRRSRALAKETILAPAESSTPAAVTLAGDQLSDQRRGRAAHDQYRPARDGQHVQPDRRSTEFEYRIVQVAEVAEALPLVADDSGAAPDGLSG